MNPQLRPFRIAVGLILISIALCRWLSDDILPLRTGYRFVLDKWPAAVVSFAILTLSLECLLFGLAGVYLLITHRGIILLFLILTLSLSTEIAITSAAFMSGSSVVSLLEAVCEVCLVILRLGLNSPFLIVIAAPAIYMLAQRQQGWFSRADGIRLAIACAGFSFLIQHLMIQLFAMYGNGSNFLKPGTTLLGFLKGSDNLLVGLMIIDFALVYTVLRVNESRHRAADLLVLVVAGLMYAILFERDAVRPATYSRWQFLPLCTFVSIAAAAKLAPSLPRPAANLEPRCRGCGYLLHGLPADRWRCPECGAAIVVSRQTPPPPPRPAASPAVGR